MIQFDLDEISAIEKNACIDYIVGMMESFGISIDDIKAALSKRQDHIGVGERAEVADAMDMV